MQPLKNTGIFSASIILLLIIFSLLSPFAISDNGQPENWWKFHYDLNNSGFINTSVSDIYEVYWDHETGSSVLSSPSVVDGKVYIGSTDEYLYCLNESDGDLIWKVQLGLIEEASPVVIDGKVYIGSTSPTKMFCLDAETGGELWNFTAIGNIHSSPTIYQDRLYFGDYSGKFYCLNATSGEPVWNFTAGGWIHTSAALANDMVFFGSCDNRLYSLDIHNGSKRWNFTAESYIPSSPTIYNTTLFVGSYDANLYSIDITTGKTIWTYSTGRGIFSSPSTDGRQVVVGSDDGFLYSFNVTQPVPEDPVFNWRFNVSDSIKSSPALTQTQVLFGSENGNLYCVDLATGILLWNYSAGGPITSSPAIANGKVIVGSADGKIYCFGPPRDTIPPVVRILEPSTGSVAEGMIYINGTATTNEAGLRISKVQVKVGNSPTWFDAKSDDGWNTWSYKLDTGRYSNGDQTIYARAFDGVKHSEPSEVIIIIKNPVIDSHSDETDESADLYQIIQFLFIAVIIFIVIIILIIIISQKDKRKSD